MLFRICDAVLSLSGEQAKLPAIIIILDRRPEKVGRKNDETDGNDDSGKLVSHKLSPNLERW